MELNWIDAAVFLTFIIAVVAVGVLMSRHEKDSEGYFLAGRGLSWWLIGFSLIAANISTEQFVGMSGQAAKYLGLAIASYEWMAAITLVVVAFFFLPKFLRSGIYTIPEFLEYRFNHQARTIMSVLMMITYVCVTITAVIFSGAVVVDVLFGGKSVLGVVPVNIYTASWAIGILAAIYVAAGGLKACAWADLLQGSALILGGAIVLVLAMSALDHARPETIGLSPEMAGAGAIAKFRSLNESKLHMVLPASDKFVPWTALVVGLWIPNFYYWGLNQYITQRVLGSRSLAEGQKGVVFAAALKLIIPFIIVVPGIIAFNLYKGDMRKEAQVKTNKAALAAFEKFKDRPGDSGIALKFDDDFARLYPERARAVISFNTAVAGAKPPAKDKLTKMKGPLLKKTNGQLLEAIKTKNKSLASADRIQVQKELIGYEYDSAFALLLKSVRGAGLAGFMLAAILGAVMSSLASMLNAASTIFTMDIYKPYVNRQASQATLVLVGRICVLIFVVVGCVIAPLLGHPKFQGIFTYIQEFQGFISPGILAVFLFGLFVRRTPRPCGVVGLLLSPAVYGTLMIVVPDWAFLDRMAVTFASVLAVMGAMTLIRPLPEPITLPVQTKINLDSSASAKVFGVVVVAATIALYVVFW